MIYQTNKAKAIFIFILAALFLCYEMGVQVSPSVMTKFLMHDLSLNAVELGFMSGFYYYSYTLMQIPAGVLFDRYQVRWVVIVPLGLCAAGSLIFANADSIVGGSMGRLLMGTGSAFAFISVLVVASDLFPERHFALFAGLTQMLAAFGAMMGEGPLLPLIQHHGWRGTMVILAIIAGILMLCIGIFVRYEKCDSFKTCKENEGVDVIAGILKLVKGKQTWYIALYACCLWAPMAAFASLWGVPYLETVYGLSQTSSAKVLSLMWLGIAFGSPLVGWLSDRCKTRKVPLVICGILGFSAFFIVNLHLPISIYLLGALIFVGGAACSGQALSFAVVKDNNEPHLLAASIGFNNMAVVISGAIFQPLVGYLIADESAIHFRHGIAVIIGCYLIGTMVAMLFIRSKKYA